MLQNLKVYVETLTGFSHVYRPDGLNNTLFFQVCIFENGSQGKNSGQNVYSKDRGGDEEPPIAWVQLEDQPTVTSS